eukprot:3135716-Prymnesium_polylepis.1
MRFVRGSINDADVLILVVDVFQTDFPDEKMLRQLKSSSAAMLVLVNKIDLLEDGSPLTLEKRAALGTRDELLARWAEEFPGASVLPVAARQGKNLDAVMERLM